MKHIWKDKAPEFYITSKLETHQYVDSFNGVRVF